MAHLRVGSYYEIDHSVQRSPEQLKSIRIGSNRVNRSKPERRSNASLLPVLDVVSSELAGDLLYRRVAPHQVSMSRRNSSGNDDINLSRAQECACVTRAGIRRRKMVGTKQKPLIMQPVREKSWLNPALGDSLRRRITRKPRSLFIRGDHLISLLTDGLLRGK